MTDRQQDDIDPWALREEEDRQFIIGHQPAFREAATRIGNFRHCALPKCKRAKKCLGCHPEDEINIRDFKRFPPCVDDNSRHWALVQSLREMDREEYSALLAAGCSPEEAKRAEQAAYDEERARYALAARRELKARAQLRS